MDRRFEKFNTVAGVLWWHIASVFHRYWMSHVFVKVIGILRDAIVLSTRHTDIVNRRQVLNVFAESNSACVSSPTWLPICLNLSPVVRSSSRLAVRFPRNAAVAE